MVMEEKNKDLDLVVLPRAKELITFGFSQFEFQAGWHLNLKPGVGHKKPKSCKA